MSVPCSTAGSRGKRNELPAWRERSPGLVRFRRQLSSEGGANSTFFEPGTIDNSAGEISLIGDVGASGVTGSGALSNVTFQALTQGTPESSSGQLMLLGGIVGLIALTQVDRLRWNIETR